MRIFASSFFISPYFLHLYLKANKWNANNNLIINWKLNAFRLTKWKISIKRSHPFFFVFSFLAVFSRHKSLIKRILTELSHKIPSLLIQAKKILYRSLNLRFSIIPTKPNSPKRKFSIPFSRRIKHLSFLNIKTRIILVKFKLPILVPVSRI